MAKAISKTLQSNPVEVPTPEPVTNLRTQGALTASGALMTYSATESGMVPIYNETTLAFDNWPITSPLVFDGDGYAAGKYDVFAFPDSGLIPPALNLAVVQWTDETTRSIELTTIQGARLKSDSLSYRYIGTVRFDGTRWFVAYTDNLGVNVCGTGNAFNPVDPADPLTGTRQDMDGFWGYTAGVIQAFLDRFGRIGFGGTSGLLDANGLSLTDTGGGTPGRVNFKDILGNIIAFLYATDQIINVAGVWETVSASKPVVATILALHSATQGVYIQLDTALHKVSILKGVFGTAIDLSVEGNITAGNILANTPATTAANDFQVGNGAGAWIKKTLAEIKTILGLGSAAYANTSDFDASGAAAGVQTSLNTHTGLTGASVHGLGTASTHAASDFAAETAASIGALIGEAADATPNDTDFVATSLTAGGVLKKITWTAVKAFLKTYFDTLYTLANLGGTPASGWIASSGWSYASATTITVPPGAASIYQKGTKLTWVANGVTLYAYVVGVANTLLTVQGNTVTNYAFSNMKYSYSENPFGFPTSFAWTPGYTGFSSNPTPTGAVWSISKAFIEVWYSDGNGVSNATTFTITGLPIAPTVGATIPARVSDNSAVKTAPGVVVLVASSTTATIRSDMGAGAWTGSNNKGVASFYTKYPY